MYCRHCGKQISDDSKFCRYCGGIQNEEKAFQVHSEDNSKNAKKIDKNIDISFIKMNLSNKVKIWLCVYIAWFLLNLTFIFIRGYYNGNKGSADDYFYPFQAVVYGEHSTYDDISNWDLILYDFSEFIVYTLLIPLLIYIVFMYLKNIKWKGIKSKIWLCVYIGWFLINLSFIFIRGRYDGSHGSSGDYFYPFQAVDSGGTKFKITYVSNWDLILYDYREFIVYALLVPLLIHIVFTFWEEIKSKGKSPRN